MQSENMQKIWEKGDLSVWFNGIGFSFSLGDDSIFLSITDFMEMHSKCMYEWNINGTTEITH